MWQVHFRPDATGSWSYQVSFRAGPGVALKRPGDDSGSEPWPPLDGVRGSFTVKESDKRGPDLRAPELGRVLHDGSHVLKYAGSGKPYLKAGEGSPENLLAYRDFDQTLDIKNTGFDDGLLQGLHQYEPHVGHWLPGDPTWKTNKGKGLIGAVNYLTDQGLNSIYFLTFNIGPKEDIDAGLTTAIKATTKPFKTSTPRF